MADCNKARTNRRIVCLCGSTRHFREFVEANRRETMAGNIVLSVGVFGHSGPEAHGRQITLTDQEKESLDKLHHDKVQMANEILVIGDPGESTNTEIQLAEKLGIPIRRLAVADLCEPS